MSDFSQPAEDLGREAKAYLDARLDDLKLRTVKGLSISMSKLAALSLLFGVFTAFVLALSFGLVLLLGAVMGGKYALAALLVALLLGIVLALLILFREKLFRNTFVPVFVKLFFAPEEDGTD